MSDERFNLFLTLFTIAYDKRIIKNVQNLSLDPHRDTMPCRQLVRKRRVRTTKTYLLAILINLTWNESKRPGSDVYTTGRVPVHCYSLRLQTKRGKYYIISLRKFVVERISNWAHGAAAEAWNSVTRPVAKYNNIMYTCKCVKKKTNKQSIIKP